jgi:hypothetical protein
MSSHDRAATVDRDSVCAGDDTEPHSAVFATNSQCTVAELLAQARRASPLASIAGGKATWLIDTEGPGQGCIGVIAQQWDEPRLLVPQDATVASLFGQHEPRIYFRYWCQADPQQVFEALRAGTGLPPRSGS